MVSVISVGIRRCNFKDMGEITCAKNDAEKIYSTFSKIVGDSFGDYSSLCMIDCKKSEIKEVLSGLSRSFGNEDICIVYFSCHGIIKDNDLVLLMKDASDDGDGILAISEIKSILHKKSGQYILVLDSCHSEAALHAANKDYLEGKSNISVIASAPFFGTSQVGEKVSPFAQAFCDAIECVFDCGIDLTFLNIARETQKRYQSIYVNTAEGKIDIPIKRSNVDYSDFADIFIEKLITSNRYVREMMWYSLAETPAKVKLEVIDKYIKRSVSVCEADWLVRRAIGSTLALVSDENQRAMEIKQGMIASENWMIQTIGLIAMRDRIDAEIAKKMKAIIRSNEKCMSVVWLADLYLSGSQWADISIPLKSNLAKTGWGLIQIWDHYWKDDNSDWLFEQIASSICDTQLLAELKTELFLRGINCDNPLENAELSALADSKLAFLLYSAKTRGRTKNAAKKWLLSMMYGNWRGYINVNLAEYFSNNISKTISIDLSNAKYIPSAEKKCALFTYLQHDTLNFEKYRECLRWGLDDPHPWVRRDALVAFRNYPEVANTAIQHISDRRLYIGSFDMLISSCKYVNSGSVYSVINQYPLTSCEKESLLLSLRYE